MRRPAMIKDKGGKLDRSQIIKWLESHDKKTSALPGGTKKTQGNSWMAETDACSLTLQLREGKGQTNL